jgi:hypothetical protein
MALQEKCVGDVDRQSHEDNSVFYAGFLVPVNICVLTKCIFIRGIDTNATLYTNKVLTFPVRDRIFILRLILAVL